MADHEAKGQKIPFALYARPSRAADPVAGHDAPLDASEVGYTAGSGAAHGVVDGRKPKALAEHCGPGKSRAPFRQGARKNGVPGGGRLRDTRWRDGRRPGGGPEQRWAEQLGNSPEPHGADSDLDRTGNGSDAWFFGGIYRNCHLDADFRYFQHGEIGDCKHESFLFSI